MAFISGSVGVMSEALHSSLDLVSASLTFFTVKEAGKPADDDHPFGHGKIETLSSLFEALLLVAAAVFIFYEAFDRLQNPQEISHQGLAMATIFISLVVSYYMYVHNRKAAEVTESSALHVNALHFLSDAVASIGILVGLILISVTGWTQIDSIMAFGVAIYIASISVGQVKKALQELADTQLPESEIDKIRRILDTFKGRYIDAHELRTRKSGRDRHMDFHMTVCKELTVEESHDLCDDIERRMLDEFSHASVSIHVEPCESERTNCHLTCPIFRRKGK